MYQIPIAHKKCATCRWWSGRRKLIFVDAMSDMKNCRAWEGRNLVNL